ncbi:hypothetical protein CONLIGDRAFT_634974 [Coniochaeta ligniaria NRRL 30616]|uniref:Uncharacterized protein n=1 Tax=Coniochaeta ligniaria NRRL 30616 TaxID=1408157 RepID=A0A1J7J0A5_9PEZI|nr:hypothetical protein CONLIGDRAFT_634974 [Coniochaeta ligniaria NRRL 30616]
MMGNNASSQVGEAGDDDSRAPSPLPGEDDGYDGLPRLNSSAPADFHVDYSQPVDAVPTFSQPAQPARKPKKSRKSNQRRSSDMNNRDGPDAESEDNNAAIDDLEAVARNLKSEPESPEIAKSKKKRRRKAKAQDSEQSGDLHIPTPDSLQAVQDLPAVPDVSAAAEEHPDLPATDLHEEDPAPTVESPNSRKKKKKSKTDKATGPRLDLNEDPIAGSDEEVVIPSSDRPSRRRKSLHDDDSGGRKFRKRTSLPAVSVRNSLTVEDIINEEPRADVVESTQGDAPSEGPIDFLSRSREPEHYETGEDNISPSVTRQGRRSRLTTTSLSASVSLAQALAAEQTQARLSDSPSEAQIQNGGSEAPSPVADGEVMDVDTFEPRLDGSVHRDLDNQDQAMEDETELPRLSQPNDATSHTTEPVDLMSTLEDDALVAMASTQPQPASDDNQIRSNQSSAEDQAQREVVFSNPTGTEDDGRGHPTASSGIGHGSSRRNGTQTKAAAKESPMALEFMLDRSRGAAKETASEAAPESEDETQVEYGRGPGSTRPDISNLLVDESLLVSFNNHAASPAILPAGMTGSSDATQATAHPVATQIPHVQTSSTHTTPRGSRTYARQPKPTFFERTEEETALAFAQLPSNEAAATPKSTKSKAKRRLPVDVPDAETGSSKRQRSSLSAPQKTPKTPRDPNAPRKPPGRKKAPETAIRSSTGLLTGALTRTEVQQVEGAVEAFRSDHGLTQQEVNAMVQQNPKDSTLKDNTLHEELWSQILDACPTRKRQKLLNWCRQKFHNFVARGTWTPEQDAEVRELVRHHGTKWSVIGQLINRHQKDVRDRWRNYLVAGENQRKHQWSEKEENDFLKIVAEALGIFQRERARNPDNDMFRTGKTNEELVDWNVVAERMEHTRSRLQCQEKWRRMREGNKINSTVLAGKLESDQRWRLKRARHEISLMSHADMYHIVLGIPSIDGDSREDVCINWKPILESQRKKYHRYTAMLLWNRLRQLVPNQEKKDVQQCAKELITMYQSDGGTFSLPGDEAFDEAKEEELLADIPPPRKRGSGKPKPGKGKKKQRLAPTGTRVVSDEFVHDSDPEEGDGADDGDSSRAEYNETSPAPEAAPREETRNGDDSQMRDADEVSLDLSNEAGQGDRGGSIDLGLHLANDGQLASDRELEQETASPKSRKKSKSKSKPKEKEATSSVKKHKKRYSGEMTLDFTPQKNGFSAINAPAATDSANTSRKRARADITGTPNGSAEVQSARKKKKTKRGSDAVLQVVEQQPADAGGAASSDDDMDDIPARLPALG